MVLFMKGCWIFLKAFLTFKMMSWSSLSVFNVTDNIYSFMYIKSDLYLCSEANLSVMNDLVDTIL